MGYPARTPARKKINIAANTNIGPTNVQGRIERFITGPLPDGFAVVAITTKAGSRVTLKGKNILNGFKVGETIKATGKTVTHPRFGDQIDVKDASYVEIGKNGLIQWLKDAGVNGISSDLAEKIVNTLGEDAIALIVEKDQRAKDLLGIKFDNIRNLLIVRYGESKFGKELAEYDIGISMRAKIFECYAEKTGRVIDVNPYSLIHDISGITFTTVDKIGRKKGVLNDDEKRIFAASHEVLLEAENEGHSWVNVYKMIEETAKKTGLINQYIAKVLTDESWQGAVPITVEVEEKNVRGWALGRLEYKETAIAQEIARKLKLPKRMTEERAAELVAKHSEKAGVKLNDLQTKAAIMAIIEPLSIITGDPGTGKTTVLDIIVRVWKSLGRDIGLGSPTGKAAQRMFEKTKVRAKTMHRMLGANGDGFNLGKANPIVHNTLAIDESSMMDIDLAFAFTSAWGKAQTLLLGDPFQLASVGAGRVFGDIINSAAVPTVHLNEIRRQAKGSNIAVGAKSIREGKEPKWGNDLKFIEAATNEEIAQKVIALANTERAAGYDIQVITPGHATDAGTINLNENLSMAANGAKGTAIIVGGNMEAFIGDKLIQLENDEKRQVFNGDSGTLVEIKGNSNNPIAVVEMESGSGKIRQEYTRGQFKELTLSHALTVHKTQGSEYDIIILALTTSHWRLLRRTLLNTAVTRAKTQCYIVGQKRALNQAINNDDSNERQTQLKQLICAMVD